VPRRLCPGTRNRPVIVRPNNNITLVTLRDSKNANRAYCDPPGSESMTCRLQEVRRRALSVLATRMAQVIALTALAALGLFGASSHESFHADGGQRLMAVAERSYQNRLQRRHTLKTIWSDRSVRQLIALPNLAVLGKERRLRRRWPGVSGGLWPWEAPGRRTPGHVRRASRSVPAHDRQPAEPISCTPQSA
jgi:hypothetical protein